MANLNVTISPRHAEFIEAEVRSGRFSSPEDVVSGSLDLLQKNAKVRADQLERLQTMIEEGLAEADRGEFIDGESFMRQMLERHDARVQSQSSSRE